MGDVDSKTEDKPLVKEVGLKGRWLSADELELVIQNCRVSIRKKDSKKSSSYKLKAEVSIPASIILEKINLSRFLSITAWDGDTYQNLLKESLELYSNLTSFDKEVIFRVISFLDISNKNIFISTMSSKLKMEWHGDLERMKLLQSSIDAGHTSIDIFKEFMALSHKLTNLKILPSSYTKFMVKSVSNKFLENVKMDKKNRAVTKG